MSIRLKLFAAFGLVCLISAGAILYSVMRVGSLPLVPYYRPGDMALAEAVRGFAGRHHAVLLANHGPVVAGADLDAAVNAVEELEETAKLYLLLRGAKTRYLTAAQVKELMQ